MVESVFVLNVYNSVTSNTANYPKVLDNRSTDFTYSMATDLGGGGVTPAKLSLWKTSIVLCTLIQDHK